jgi:hypothetical protein
MDKKMISVDDLIRQRLAGGEEKERDGSWGRMRELLDKEMPRDKAAGMGWRRPLMYVGMLLLGSTLSWGGYEMFHGAGAAGNAVASTLPTGRSAHAGVSGNPSATSVAVAEGGINGAPTTESAGSQKHNVKGQPSATANSVAAAASGNANHGRSHIIHPANPGTAVETAFTTTSPIAHTATGSRIAATDKAAAKTKGAATASSHLPVAAGSVATANTPKGLPGKTAPAIASASGNHSGNIPNNIAKTQQAAQPNNAGSAVLHVPASAATASISHNKKITLHTEQAARTTTGSGPQSGHGNGTPTVAAGSTASGKAKAKVEETVTVNKVVLNKRYVHDDAGGHYKFDTVSKEQLYEQLHAVSGIINTTIGNVTQEGVMEHAVASNGSAGTSGSNLSATSSVSATPSLKAATEAKSAKEMAKQSGATKLLTNLSAAFNDIKMNAKGSQFQAGLTGGINGSFFGPANFYGFDFGVSGTMNVSDNVGIVSELKYFHRINSGYEFNDDYYVYESNNGAGGGWKKSKIDYDYSFSTLHSLELPLYLKYTVANFSFFGGANFSYIFGINTSAAPLPDPNFPAQIVAAKSNDDHATVSYSDFGQRFGIGYLFGIAFKLSPTVTLDLRSAQNCWDNLKSAGAKTVSTTLYNTPSTQVSLNFRLGAPKKENMDK